MAEPLRVCPSVHLNWVDEDSKIVSTVTKERNSPSLSIEDIFKEIYDEGDLVDLSESENFCFQFDVNFSRVSLYVFTSECSATNFVPPSDPAGPVGKFGGRACGISRTAVSRATKEALEAHHLNSGFILLGRLISPLVTLALKRLLSLKTDGTSLEVHAWIYCDGCEESSISTTRYKCLECADYDLCAICYEKNKHSDHVMLRIPIKFVREQKSQYPSVIKGIIAAAKGEVLVLLE